MNYKDNNIDFKSILTDRSLSLEKMEKKLILRALIICNFSLNGAFKLNCEGSFRTYDSYVKQFRKHFPLGKMDLKERWKIYKKEYDENKNTKASI